MNLTITKTIGTRQYEFTVEGQNLFQVLMEAQKLSFPDVDKCGLCGKTNLTLEAHKAQEKFEYVSIKCLNYECRASLTFGKTMEDPNTYFLRRDKDTKEYSWKPFETKDGETKAAPQKQSAPPPKNTKQSAPVKTIGEQTTECEEELERIGKRPNITDLEKWVAKYKPFLNSLPKESAAAFRAKYDGFKAAIPVAGPPKDTR